MKQILLTILISLFLGRYNSIACLCKTFNSQNDIYKYSESVLVGTIISQRDFDVKNSDSSGFSSVSISAFKLVIEKVFKGAFKKDTIIIFTGSTSESCGYKFIVGSKYIVYGMNDNYFQLKTKHLRIKGKNIIWTNICSGTSIYSLERENEVQEIANRPPVRVKGCT